MRQITIKDVAERAGVSITTVSFVLNNSNPRISEKTREKVLQVVEELDYHSNKLAASMVTKRSNILGMVIPDTSNMFFTELARVITNEAQKNGYAVLYGGADNSMKRDMDFLRAFVDYRVDGIIMAHSASSNEGEENDMLKYLRKLNLPYIMVDRTMRDSTDEAVNMDHCYGGYLATRHLISMGHKRIGCLTGPSGIYTSMQRLDGYKRALEEAGIPYKEDLVFEGDFTMKHCKEAVDYLLRKQVSAVFAFNDMMALGLYKELAVRGLSVPGDLSIVGYDNILLSDMVNPPLTTISQPIDKIAGLVVRRISEMIEGKTAEKTEVLIPELVVRESTALL